jgi:hypothetical protein
MPLIVDPVEDEIMKEISADLDIPYSVVRDVVINGQSGFTKHVIESGGYNSVRWPKFGIFKLKAKFMLVKKHMRGLSIIDRKITKYRIKQGLVFERKKK